MALGDLVWHMLSSSHTEAHAQYHLWYYNTESHFAALGAWWSTKLLTLVWRHMILSVSSGARLDARYQSSLDGEVEWME